MKIGKSLITVDLLQKSSHCSFTQNPIDLHSNRNKPIQNVVTFLSEEKIPIP